MAEKRDLSVLRHLVRNLSDVTGGHISCLHCEPCRVPYAAGTYRLRPEPARLLTQHAIQPGNESVCQCFILKEHLGAVPDPI